MKAFLVLCIPEDTKPYIKQLKQWMVRQQFGVIKLMHLEDSMVMYGIYNAETLENS